MMVSAVVVRWGGEVIEMDEGCPVLMMGREPCD
jgi:hypothetical protein